MKRTPFATLAAVPVVVVLGAGIAHAEGEAEQLRTLLASQYLPSLELVTPAGSPRDAPTEAHRICAQLGQDVAANLPGGTSAVYAEAFQVSLDMIGNSSGVTALTIPQAEQLVKDTASIYCPQYANK